MTELIDISVSGPSAEQLADITRIFVDERLVACGNIVPSIRSIYRWHDAVEDEHEALVILHTRAELAELVTDRILQLHPYDTPQVLCVSVTHSAPGYARWVIDSTTS